MRLSCALAVLLCALVAAAGEPRAKQPWEWTTEERLAARFDEGKRQARVDRALAGKAPQKRPTDLVNGQLDLELLLPTEIVSIFVTTAYAHGKDEVAQIVIDDATARAAKQRLPDDFMVTFERELAPFTALLAEELRLLDRIMRSETDASVGMARVHELRALQCGPRARAIQRLRATYGTAFDRFLYLELAPGMGSTVYNAERDANMLRREEAGCP